MNRYEFHFNTEKTNKSNHFTYGSPVMRIALTTIFGCILWIFSAIYYSGVIIDPLFIIHPILFIIVYFIGWFGAIIAANMRRNGISFIFYVFSVLISGQMMGILIGWSVTDTFTELDAMIVFFFVISVAVLAVVGAVIVGLIFVNDQTRNILLLISICGLLLIIIVEIILLVLNIDIFYNIISIAVIIFVLLGTTGKAIDIFIASEEGKWMRPVISLTLDFILITLRLYMMFKGRRTIK